MWGEAEVVAEESLQRAAAEWEGLLQNLVYWVTLQP
jgi:hypothetical protein